MIRITVTSVFVDDQEKALRFYTDVLGFVKARDISLGECRWLTVSSPASDEIELLLEPNGNPAAAAYQESIYEQGIPATTFAVDDIREEYRRLKALGVTFTAAPTEFAGVARAVLDDTCGNLIQLHQVTG